MKLGNENGSDVALLRLRPNLHYDNTLFQGRSETDEPNRISGFASADDYLIGQEVTMNTPFSGVSRGLFIASGLKLVTDPNPDLTSSTPFEYVEVQWTAWGNGRTEDIDGSCGAPVIYSPDNTVISLFRFMSQQNGIGYGLAAIELESFGFDFVNQVSS